MQDEFGKKLEEARTRLGVSIRQASEDLKIRSDFLLSFENDHGNFTMPDVYKRGFIKLYARYLKLDPMEIVADFNNYQLGALSPKQQRKQEEAQRESLGRMDLSGTKTESPQDLQTTLPLNTTEPIKSYSAEESKKHSYPSTQNLYMKIGLIFGGSFAALAIIAIIVTNLISNPSELPSSNEIQQTQEASVPLAANPQEISEQLILSGDESIHIVVRQENNKKRLFAGNVDKDHPVTVARQGPVKVHFSDGSKLTIQKPNGKKIRPGREGVGWIEL